MAATAVRYLHDPLSRFNLHLLKETLRPHLPSCKFPDFLRLPPNKSELLSGRYVPGRIKIPQGWHFVYFPSIPDENLLYADGYDPVSTTVQLTGLSRRRWRGGELVFGTSDLMCEEPGQCVLTEEVTIKGHEACWDRIDEITVRRMSNSTIGDDDPVLETRHLVYLASRFMNEKALNHSATKRRPIKTAMYTPMFQTTLTPTRALVFRFSALTFNAHRIHYDPLYATAVEQLPDVIVQGALSLVLIMSWLQFDSQVCSALGISYSSVSKKIQRVRYSCVHNIIVDKEIKIGIMPWPGLTGATEKWRIWIEQDGGICLKGTVTIG
ncbi:hypothetical protein V1525DRAFT_431321 [Lipomyces kononenkoae]|uniref:Uncharacterized protein n=1 Tax=Lipomyces kononenkoae TaxID=34357 RepID=A0ACC3T5U6_LIPKO